MYTTQVNADDDAVQTTASMHPICTAAASDLSLKSAKKAEKASTSRMRTDKVCHPPKKDIQK
jgi:hypothetical protein